MNHTAIIAGGISLASFFLAALSYCRGNPSEGRTTAFFTIAGAVTLIITLTAIVS